MISVDSRKYLKPLIKISVQNLDYQSKEIGQYIHVVVKGMNSTGAIRKTHLLAILLISICSLSLLSLDVFDRPSVPSFASFVRQESPVRTVQQIQEITPTATVVIVKEKVVKEKGEAEERTKTVIRLPTPTIMAFFGGLAAVIIAFAVALGKIPADVGGWIIIALVGASGIAMVIGARARKERSGRTNKSAKTGG